MLRRRRLARAPVAALEDPLRRWRALQRLERIRRLSGHCEHPGCRNQADLHHLLFGAHRLPEPWRSWWPFTRMLCGPGNAGGHHRQAHSDPDYRDELIAEGLRLALIELPSATVADRTTIATVTLLVTGWIAAGATPPGWPPS